MDESVGLLRWWFAGLQLIHVEGSVGPAESLTGYAGIGIKINYTCLGRFGLGVRSWVGRRRLGPGCG